MRSLRNTLDKILLQYVEPKFIYTGTKLSAKFQIKSKIKDEHKHDLEYFVTGPECNAAETGRRLQDWIDAHSGKESKTNIVSTSTKKIIKLRLETICKFLEMDTRR